MLVFLIFAFFASTSQAGYAGSSSQSDNGVGQGYGFGGSFSGGAPPNFPVFDFNNFLSSYFESLRKYHEQFANNIQQNVAAGYGQPGGFSSSFPAGVPGGEGASASGSIGPGGGYQSAGVYPENPNNPNIFNRFGGGEEAQKPNGFYGVFTSSHSSTSDVDGKKTSAHEAQTTINDNGKVTTYKVKNP
ncbi:PREDICTED: uncharacterized protein LOC108558059 [Nicrophorus vespilloides]|uniref:Uncharacterized protein LOC108558059 n=1 Tax=Nicrophorus vespilloides TaxID=110193 RepID=A0ABM1M6Z8_NICVS|nr:PREDICTED: uncharacterized protein LOC108558059 [Nicrophorus vespilloides]